MALGSTAPLKAVTATAASQTGDCQIRPTTTRAVPTPGVNRRGNA